MRIVFTVDGAPVGWQRAGTNRYSGRHYTQERTRETERMIAYVYQAAAHGFRFKERTPVSLTVLAYYPIPKSVSRATRARMIAREILPVVKPDWDNVGKLVSDALNGVAYGDDKEIVAATVIKMYSDRPRMRIVLEDADELFMREINGGEVDGHDAERGV